MTAMVRDTKRATIKGLDTNSLLRILDTARIARYASPTQSERDRAGRMHDRAANELRRRGEDIRR